MIQYNYIFFNLANHQFLFIYQSSHTILLLQFTIFIFNLKPIDNTVLGSELMNTLIIEQIDITNILFHQ